MALNDAVFKSFYDGYAEVKELYDNDQIDDCLEVLLELLEAPELPRYIRIKCLLVYSACMADWNIEGELIKEADELWHVTRRFHRVGRDENVDEALTELRGFVDAYIQEHENTRPEDKGLEDAYGVVKAESEMWNEGAEKVYDNDTDEALHAVDDERHLEAMEEAGAKTDVGEAQIKSDNDMKSDGDKTPAPTEGAQSVLGSVGAGIASVGSSLTYAIRTRV